MMEFAMIKPPKRESEAYRIVYNFRYILIRYKNGKFYALDGKTCSSVDSNILKKLLSFEKELVKKYFGEQHYYYKILEGKKWKTIEGN